MSTSNRMLGFGKGGSLLMVGVSTHTHLSQHKWGYRESTHALTHAVVMPLHMLISELGDKVTLNKKQIPLKNVSSD